MELKFISKIQSEMKTVTEEEIKNFGERLGKRDPAAKPLDIEVNNDIRRLLCLEKRRLDQLDAIFEEARKSKDKELNRKAGNKVARLKQDIRWIRGTAMIEIRECIPEDHFGEDGALLLNKNWQLSWLPLDQVDPVAFAMSGMFISRAASKKMHEKDPVYIDTKIGKA